MVKVSQSNGEKMEISKEQIKFLESLPKSGNVSAKDIPESKMSIVIFLEKLELVNAQREIVRTDMDRENQTYKNICGEILSVSRSEQGDAYLEWAKREKKHFILKNIVIPVVVSLITNLIIVALQLLLSRIQG